MLRRLLALMCSLPLLLGLALPCDAAELQLSEVRLEPCGQLDAGNQPELSRPVGASCYVLTGDVENRSKNSVIDTDVYARILDASGEPVLPNSSRCITKPTIQSRSIRSGRIPTNQWRI